MSTSSWSIEGAQAQLRLPGIQASVQLDRPSQGVREIVVNGQETQAGLLAVTIAHRTEPTEPVEAYARGDDVLFHLPPRSLDLVSHHLMYRAEQCDDHIRLSLFLSAQTSLLESDPLTEVRSVFGPGELLAVDMDQNVQPLQQKTEFANQNAAPAYFLLRPDSMPSLSVLLYIHPSDFHTGFAVVSDSGITVSWEVFPYSLEKGVIRRATFGCVSMARERDLIAAARLYDGARLAPPPLTT